MLYRTLLLFCLLPLGLGAQQSTNEVVNARAELATKEIEIGDQVFLTVKISAPPATEVQALEPAYLNTVTGIELVEGKALNVVAETPERLLEQRFLITSFDTGYVAITPLPYAFRAADGGVDTAYTNDLLLKVSAYPVTDDSELQPIKGIIEEPRNWLDFWPLYLVLLLAGGGYLAYRAHQNRTRVAPPPPPPPPADLQALNSLQALEGKQLWQSGQTKLYYTELTDILRTYLQDQFGVQAKEMTSRQITTSLKKNVGMNGNMTGELAQLLQLSDLVKFAKATPAAELHPRSLERVRSFVRDSRAAVATNAPAPPEGTTPGPAAPPTPAPASAPDSGAGPAPNGDLEKPKRTGAAVIINHQTEEE